jgi:hypothetical protein
MKSFISFNFFTMRHAIRSLYRGEKGKQKCREVTNFLLTMCKGMSSLISLAISSSSGFNWILGFEDILSSTLLFAI